MNRGHRRARSRACAVALAALALVACGPSDLLGPEAEQGIDGLVLRGPICPVQSLEDPCPDQPYRAWIDVRRRDGSLVTRVRSGEDGRFLVGLKPGAYTLDPESGSPFPVASEMDVDVVEGVWAEVVVSYDTGIR